MDNVDEFSSHHGMAIGETPNSKLDKAKAKLNKAEANLNKFMGEEVKKREANEHLKRRLKALQLR